MDLAIATGENVSVGKLQSERSGKGVKIKILHNPIISFKDPLTVFILEKERCIPNQTVALDSQILSCEFEYELGYNLNGFGSRYGCINP